MSYDFLCIYTVQRYSRETPSLMVLTEHCCDRERPAHFAFIVMQDYKAALMPRVQLRGSFSLILCVQYGRPGTRLTAKSTRSSTSTLWAGGIAEMLLILQHQCRRICSSPSGACCRRA